MLSTQLQQAVAGFDEMIDQTQNDFQTSAADTAEACGMGFQSLSKSPCGKKADTRQILAEIYGWFTEGFDMKDLQEAKALLEELR